MGEQVIYINNDNLVTLTSLEDNDGNPVIDAEANITLQDLTGTNVAGSAWPITLTYDATTASDYKGTLPETLVLKDKASYVGVITASTPGGLDLEMTCHYIARKRSCE